MLKEDVIKDYAKTLELINYQVAELCRIKEELEGRLAAFLEHPDEGQKTYIQGKYKITVNTGFNYTLNKEEYEILGNRLPACFQPVTKRVAYDLNKDVIRDIERYGSKEEIKLLSEFVSKKPKKLYIKLSQGV